MTKPFCLYDARHYPTVDVVTDFDEWAQAYDQTVDSPLDLALKTPMRHLQMPTNPGRRRAGAAELSTGQEAADPPRARCSPPDSREAGDPV